MKMKINGLPGRGFAHPGDLKRFISAAEFVTAGGLTVDHQQHAGGMSEKQNISLKNEGGAIELEAENIAYFVSVVDCWCLVVVSGKKLKRAKEKGAAGGHALRFLPAQCCRGYLPPFNCCASCCAMPTSSRRWSPACVPISPIRSSASSAPLRLVKSFSSPFSLSWRRAISPCIAVTINPAEVSPSALVDSIPETTSCGTLTVNNCDFAFLFADAMKMTPENWCVSVYMKMKYKKDLTCVSRKIKVKHTLSTGSTQGNHSGNNQQHYQHSDRSPVHAFHHQHWRHSHGVAGWRQHSINHCDEGAFQGAMCAPSHADWQGIKTAKPGSVGALTGPLTTIQTTR